MPSTVLLPSLSQLRLAGPDCASFLQGYVTSDVDDATESWSLSAFTNLKGRVFATVLLRRATHEQIDLIASTDIADTLASFLSKYLMFAKCELQAIEATLCLTAHLDGLATDAGDESFALPRGLRDEPTGALYLVALEGSPSGFHDLTDGTDQWLERLVNARVGWVGADASEQHLPQMLGLLEHDAVSFSKGCYLGQEIVARVEHRGAVKRHLVALVYSKDDEAATPNLGAALVDENGREVGNIVVLSPALHRALAVVALDVTTLSTSQGAVRFTVV